MSNDADVLTAAPADATNIIEQLPVLDAERESLFASLSASHRHTPTGLERLRTGLMAAAVLIAATVLAVALISMMGRN